MRPIAACAAAALAAAWSGARRAEACSCDDPAEILSPPDGATRVPTNAVVAADLGTPDVTIAVIEAATGVEVPVIVEETSYASPGRRFAIARPEEGLRPDTAYVAALRRDGWDVRTAPFTTGASADAEPPAFVGLASFGPETMAYPAGNCVSSCVWAHDGHVDRARLGYADDAEVAWLRLEIRRAGEAAPYDELLIQPGARWSHDLESYSCAPRAPFLEPGVQVCARLTGYDLAGNAAGGDAERCEVALACAPYSDAECEPGDMCAADPEQGSPDAGAPEEELVSGPACACRAGSRSRPPAFAPLVLLLATVARRRRSP